MKYLTHLDFPYDKEQLISIAALAKESATYYTDDRFPNLNLTSHLISYYNNEYLESLIRSLDISGQPRFYYMQPYSFFPTHTDNQTKCSINIILSNDPAPITLLGKDLYYKCAIIDTTKPHSVRNNFSERVLFKISIFDKSYKSILNQLELRKFIK
jgi:hypothetical protein